MVEANNTGAFQPPIERSAFTEAYADAETTKSDNCSTRNRYHHLNNIPRNIKIKQQFMDKSYI
jgi:hypothetical protein